MRKLHRWLIFIALVGAIAAQTPGPADAALRAFPGAEGFGAQTVGGRGGKVYFVTNTNDSGTGSLRACTQATGPRICIFLIGGLIVLKTPLIIRHPYITIAGQTAPGGGITLRTAAGGDVFGTQTSQVIMRYLSVRPGPGGENHGDQIALDGTTLHDIMLDHMTYSWGVDLDIETWYRVVNLTIQWSLISEALNCSTHSKGCHSKGLMIGGYAGSESYDSEGSQNISVLHNLMAHDADRTPLMQMCGTAQVINNVTYNPSVAFSHQQDNCYVPPNGIPYINLINWVGNYHKKGPDSTEDTDLKVIPSDSGVYSGGAQVYVQGNIGPSRPNDTLPDSDWVDPDSRQFMVSTPAVAPTVTTTDAFTAYADVLNSAGNSMGLDCHGNWYVRRDAIDARVVQSVRSGTGHIINSPSQVGGWIAPGAGTPCLDSDHDGMPDAWELRYGLNPHNPADATQDLDSDGYTNLEEYLNGTNPTSTSNTQSLALYSNGAQDGWILESTAGSQIGGTVNAGGATLAAGDSASGQQYRSIVSFNTGVLPRGAVITSAVIKLRKAAQVGSSPFGTLGNIVVDEAMGAFGSSGALLPSDFQAPASLSPAASFANAPVGAWYSASLDSSGLADLNLTGVTQFRFGFEIPSNQNAVADYLEFYSGNYAAPSFRPTLVVSYSLP